MNTNPSSRPLRLFTAAFALLAATTLTSKGHAQTTGLTVTLLPTTATVAALYPNTQDYTFSATLTNTLSTPLFLNGDDFRVDFPLSIDDSAFQNTFAYPTDANGDPLPQTPLAPHSSITVPLFDALIPGNTAEGTYGGAFTIQGGADGSSYGLLSTSNFTVSSVHGAPAVPEASTTCEFGVGAVLLAGMTTLKASKRRSSAVA